MTIFSCPKCEFQTSYRSNLARHLVRHEEEAEVLRQAALTCDWCGQAFSNKYNCNRHKNNNCPRNPEVILRPAPNVNPSVPNVNLPASNVNPPAPNVNLGAPNVNREGFTTPYVNSNGSTSKKFPCPTCFRVYSRNSLLQKHIDVCDGTSTIYECAKCHAIFSCRQTKSKHMKNCTGNQSEMHSQQITTTQVNSNNQISNNINSHNTTNIQNIETQIVLNGFGKEFIGHLTPEFLAQQALRAHGEGIVKCIESVHFNPEYPENQNMRLVENPDVPKTAIAVYDNDQWALRDYFNTMRTLIQHFCFMLKYRASQPDFRVEHHDSWETVYSRLQSLTVNDNPQDFYAIIREVKLLLQKLDKVMV